MIPQPFLLAVPNGWRGHEGVEPAPHISLACAAQPRLWLGPGTRSVGLGRGRHAIGLMFDRHGRPVPGGHEIALPSARSQPAIAQWLAREYWGAYLAILPGEAGEVLRVFCDPSGLLPVFRASGPTHSLISSDPALIALATRVPPAIDWTALRAHLCWPEYRASTTCLQGVEELTPGALATPGNGSAQLPVWNLLDHLPGPQPAPSFAEATALLRACAITCVGAWATLSGSVAVAASGGVDSSLICAALAAGGHSFTCATLATADPSGDERSFVATLADHLGVAMEAQTYDFASLDLTRSASLGLPRPARRTLSLAIDASLEQARVRLGASAVFDGNGGDNLFCFLHSAAPVLDRVAAEGIRAALPTLLDMCAVTGADVPAMLRAVWRRSRRQTPKDHWPAERDLLAHLPGEDSLPPAVTPWLDRSRHALGGKRDHLALIMHAQNHVHGLSKPGVPRFSPLMSQPLVELCMGFPTWLWCHGGINRAIARAAFADMLPQAVLRRTSKAGPDSFLRRLFAQNRALIRSMLLEGNLARQGLLDRPALETAMATDTLSQDAAVYRLLDLCEAEAWTRSWIG